jgi:hypothetical protein
MTEDEKREQKRRRQAAAAFSEPLTEAQAHTLVTFLDGWVPHPQAPGFFYRGPELISAFGLSVSIAPPPVSAGDDLPYWAT